MMNLTRQPKLSTKKEIKSCMRFCHLTKASSEGFPVVHVRDTLSPSRPCPSGQGHGSDESARRVPTSPFGESPPTLSDGRQSPLITEIIVSQGTYEGSVLDLTSCGLDGKLV
jgi:hypothetical protein